MSKEKICGIYCIKNLVNGKIYVGQSINVDGRWRQHLSHLRKNTHNNEHLQDAWNKYGKENFDFQIIEICDVDKLDIRERYWIEYYNSMSREFGYNHEDGGRKNKTVSDFTKNKISKNHSDVSGKNNPFYGKKHTNESIKKISNNREYSSENSHLAKLTLEQAMYIKKYLKENKTTCADELNLAKQFNVGLGAIQGIKHNKTWKKIIV